MENFDFAVDEWGDSYARDVVAEDLAVLLETMPKIENDDEADEILAEQLLAGNEDIYSKSPGFMFNQLTIAFVSGKDRSNGDAIDVDQIRPVEPELTHIRRILNFGGAKVIDTVNSTATHVVFGKDRTELAVTRKKISSYRRLPRLVTTAWVQDCWRERTLLDEETYVP